MNRRFLVTGGAGFLGAALVRRLLADGHRVRVLDNGWRAGGEGVPHRLAGLEAAQAAGRLEMAVADIRDAAAVRAAVQGVDCVAHLASVNGTEHFYTQPELVLDVGIRGMLNVLDACRAEAVGDLVVASSSEAYQVPPVVPTPEDVPLVVPDVRNMRYSYGGQKIACELMAQAWGRTGFRRLVVFRPHNVYGADMGWEHVIPQLAVRTAEAAEAAAPGAPVELGIRGDGRQTRAFIHVDDFTDGLMTVIGAGEHLGIYHIGNPEEITVAEVARAIAARLGREIRLVPGPAPAGETPRRCPDIGRLAALGFTPRIPFLQGIGSVVDWYAANRRRPSSARPA
jgi:dTDP-glucose 4,6-dehydratase/UDP-glucose 4-epimerase